MFNQKLPFICPTLRFIQILWEVICNLESCIQSAWQMEAILHLPM
mgnify:CR=1 FL=1